MSSSKSTACPANNKAPRYTHDCECCHFLGGFIDDGADGDGQYMDLYVHTLGIPSVIARASSDGSDYMSGYCFSFGQLAPLTEARRRAQQAELMPYNPLIALRYTTPADGESYAELKEALPRTPEYRAYLAFENGDFDTSQSLLNTLVSVMWDENKKYKPEASRFDAISGITDHINKMLQVLRAADPLESMRNAHAATAFACASVNAPEMLLASARVLPTNVSPAFEP